MKLRFDKGGRQNVISTRTLPFLKLKIILYAPNCFILVPTARLNILRKRQSTSQYRPWNVSVVTAEEAKNLAGEKRNFESMGSNGGWLESMLDLVQILAQSTRRRGNPHKAQTNSFYTRFLYSSSPTYANYFFNLKEKYANRETPKRHAQQRFISR